MAPPDRYRPRKRPRQQRSAQTRERILAAAARIFSEHGYTAGTTNRIAERAGLSIGSLYQYFPNKDAILRALMDQHFDAGSALLTQRLAAGLPPRLDDALRVFVRATIDNHRDDPRLHRVLFEEAPHAPSFLARLHEAEELAVAAVTRLLDAHPEVRVTDTAVSARIVVATIESLVHRLLAAPVDAGRLEDEIVALLTGYLRGPTGTSQPADQWVPEAAPDCGSLAPNTNGANTTSRPSGSR